VRNDEPMVYTIIFEGEAAMHEWRTELERLINALLLKEQETHVQEREAWATISAWEREIGGNSLDSKLESSAPTGSPQSPQAEPGRSKLSKTKSLSRVFSKNRFSRKPGTCVAPRAAACVLIPSAHHDDSLTHWMTGLARWL